MKVGWKREALEAVCQLITDGSHFSPRLTSKGFPYVTVRDLTEGQIDFNKCSRIDESDFLELCRNGCNPLHGDVLFSKDGTVGKVALVESGPEFVVLSSLAIVRADKAKVLPEYLAYAMQSPDFLDAAIGKKTGAAIRRIVLKNLRQIQVQYPNIEEQQRIVSILDAAFAEIVTAKANAEQNLQNALALFESHLQSVFADSCEGMPTTLGEAYDVRDGTHDSPKFHDTGYPLVTSKNLKRDGLNFDAIKFISEQDYRKINERSAVNVGDVLFAMIGTIGNPVVVEDEPNFAIKNVALFKVPSDQNSRFLRYFLSSEITLSRMKSEANGTTQKFVGLGYLRKFPLRLPSLERQRQVVSELDVLLVQSQRLESLYQQKLVALDELKKSLLHQAFSGAL